MTVETLLLRFDGGCRPTNPGNMYGSFEVHRRTRSLKSFFVFRELRFELGPGTNNVAEWQSLLRGLRFLLKDLAAGGYSPGRYRLEILTDSMILANHLLNPSGSLSKNERTRAMQELANQSLKLIFQFGEWEVQWQSRKMNLLAFGH